jgi:hypothetical protein
MSRTIDVNRMIARAEAKVELSILAARADQRRALKNNEPVRRPLEERSGLLTGSEVWPLLERLAPKSDLGGLVAGDFHADADFDDHRGGPGHVHFLRLKNSPFRGDVSSRFSAAPMSGQGRFELGRELA